MKTVYERRVSSIIGNIGSTRSIGSWLSTLGPDGKWPSSEVDLTTGCEARRASWPAQTHWRRIVTMAGAWHGGAPSTAPWNNNTELRNATSLAMGYWISRDMGEQIACLDRGGTPACPCANPGNTLWNTNWFSNIILIPELVAHACLLLLDSLTPSEKAFCGNVTTRTYRLFERGIYNVPITGANTLDIAKISADSGLLTNNEDIVADSYRIIHEEIAVRNEVRADGIRADGSFGQHEGVLYNGNYGKDYSGSAIELEIAAAGTKFQAGSGPIRAMEVLFEGNAWMIFTNTITKVLHWDFSVIGRMLTFPVIDAQASGDIRTELSAVLELGELWSSNTLQEFTRNLWKETSNANAGNLVGNKMFYANDYMVHRTPSHVSTLKMYSTRTRNTECVNNQNRKGFHLADGTLYTYQKGDEYEDIFASWDWDLIPGTTVDYRNTPLSCDTTTQAGIEAFVGGLSDGYSGISAMRYTNPVNRALSWQKTWFFLESGVYHVMINVLSSTSNASVLSVLDQKRRSGETRIDGQFLDDTTRTSLSYPKSIWHDNIGYTFPPDSPVTLDLRTGPATGNWLDIGTSTRPSTTVDLWAAWLTHNSSSIGTPVEYTMWPAHTFHDFLKRSYHSPVITIENNRDVSAILDKKANCIMAVFWGSAGGSVTYKAGHGVASLTVSSDTPLIARISLNDGTIRASDPSQTRASATLAFKLGRGGRRPGFWHGPSHGKTVPLTFPMGGFSGSGVQTALFL